MVHVALPPSTPTAETVTVAQNQIDLYKRLARETGGHVNPAEDKNQWYLLEFKGLSSGHWKFVDNRALFANLFGAEATESL
eukprot:9695935-Ditylum_brightwellii.AAC.1